MQLTGALAGAPAAAAPEPEPSAAGHAAAKAVAAAEASSALYLERCVDFGVKPNVGVAKELLRLARRNGAAASGGGVQELDFSSNYIGDRGMLPVVAVLRDGVGMRGLVRIDLGSNGIRDEGLAAIAGCLRRHERLTALDLSNNQLSDKSAAARRRPPRYAPARRAAVLRPIPRPCLPRVEQGSTARRDVM